MDKAHAAPRCCARTRSGLSCQSPAMANGRCRMHGGASTGPRTAEGLARSKRAAWKHGRRSARYVALKRLVKQAARDLRETTKLSEQMLRNAGW
ncbi:MULTISPECIES: HGGxSTG domain-containing protein [Methylobacteriaceae]|uniref:HGGxSTG domain-containing protein n=1 Tax=Methylobacteriaceae TaxID=119045 RepID=UPI002F358041